MQQESLINGDGDHGELRGQPRAVLPDTLVALVSRSGLGGLGGHNAEALGPCPASAHGFPPPADMGPPGESRPDRSRWQTWLTHQWAARGKLDHASQTRGYGIDFVCIYIFFFSWQHVLRGEFLVYSVGNKPSYFHRGT